MKRGHSSVLHEQNSATPSRPGHSKKAPGTVATREKRHRQLTINQFFDQNVQEDTPALATLNPGPAKSAFPFTALGKLERFHLRTPAEPAVEQQDLSSIQAGPSLTQRPSQPTQPPPRSQQGLQAQNDEDDDFSICMSQHYLPARSQANQDDFGEDLHTSYSQQCPIAGNKTSSQFEAPTSLQGEPSAQAVSFALEGQGSSQPTETLTLTTAHHTRNQYDWGVEDGDDHEGDNARRRSGASRHSVQRPAASVGPAVTPELNTGAAENDLQDDGTTPAPSGNVQVASSSAQQLFGIFRPGNHVKKVLIIVRHGESTYNHACSRSSSFLDPDHIFDAPLTDLGISQARNLRGTMLQLVEKYRPMFGEPLFVASPLTRAIQTMLTMNPFPDQMKANTLNVAVTHLHAEWMKTTGDVGRPPEALAEEFPELAPHLLRLPGCWWHHEASKGSNCAIQRVMSSKETKASLQGRVSKFKGWLRQRSERFIIAVGHACFWREFEGGAKHDGEYMRNCDWKIITDW